EDRAMAVWWATPVECYSAFARLRRNDILTRAQEDQARRVVTGLAAGWTEVQPSHQVRETASRVLLLHPLRAADAVQLAPGLPCELEAELHDGRELALVEADLPVTAQAGHLAQERLEEPGVEIPPRARHLLVEPPAERREPAEREPARAGPGDPPRHVAGAIADQRHHAPVDRRQDDLAVALGVRSGDLHVEIELVHVVADAVGALEGEDRRRLGRGVRH